MYERKTEPIASRTIFYKRILGNTVRVFVILGFMLLIGTIAIILLHFLFYRI